MAKIKVYVSGGYRIVNGKMKYIPGHYKWVDVDPWKPYSINRKRKRRTCLW